MVVLSRVTLGADIAITSVILDAVKRRFPQAAIHLAGSEKAAELFRNDTRVRHISAEYPRGGSVRDRLRSWRKLAASIAVDDTIVVDPDSRLTQLGLLPLGADSHYFFFESRAYGGDANASLGALAADWATRTFGVDVPRAFIAPLLTAARYPTPFATVSLGAGGNASKTLPQAFESALIKLLCQRFASVVVDAGFGNDEGTRVASAVAGTPAYIFQGTFSEFASLIAQSACYVGYDSAGQHAAAVSGTPLLTLFKGFVTDRMFARWQPDGPGPKQILKLTETPGLDIIRASLDALTRTA